jgi:hypothetical protein
LARLLALASAAIAASTASGDGRVHLGDDPVEVGLQAVGDLGHQRERAHL